MKKLFLILIMSVFVLVANAQITPTAVTPDGYVSAPTSKYIWGTTADTLTNADTLNFVFRVKGNWTQDFTIKLYSDFVSGTAGGTLTAYSSPDGVNYAALDTAITVTSLTGDAMDAETIGIDDFMYPYLKFIYLQTGTAVTIPKVYVYSKKN